MYNHRTGAYLIISNSPIIKKNIYRKTNYEKMQYSLGHYVFGKTP